MQKQAPLFLNVDLSPQPGGSSYQLKGKMQIHKSKTPTKATTILKSQPRYQSPMETQPTRQTSTMMSKADLASKRSGISTRSQFKDFLGIEQTQEKQEKQENTLRNDKSLPKTSDFQQFYQRSLMQGVKVPQLSYSPQQSITPPKLEINKSNKLIQNPINQKLEKKEHVPQKVRIFMRIKPINSNEKSIVKKISNNHLSVNTFEDTQRQFEFSQVFENASQDEVYNQSSKQIVTDCIQGKANGVILVYGQTGSGKTYTMGLLEQSKGLIQIAIQDVFQQLDQQVAQKKCGKYLVEMSFIQIYLDKIYDLLNNNGQQLLIREQKDSYPYVQGSVQMQVNDSNEGIQLVSLGVKNRVVASQVMNLNSSRSHTLLTIYIKRIGVTDNYSQQQEISSKVAFLDLAGSERNKKSMSKGIRLEEATSINESLSALGNVIVALGQPNQQHVPFRESKLTRILQGYLSGESQISLICTVTKSAESTNETIQTLMFAQRCKDVVLRPQKIIPIQDEDTLDHNDLQKQISELKSTISNLQDQLKQQKLTKSLQQKQQQWQQQSDNNLIDKEFNKFIVSIIVKLKQYTSQNIQIIQEQEKQSVNDKLLITNSQQSPYKIEQFPQEIQQILKNQIFQDPIELDSSLIDQCFDGNRDSIKELAKIFTQDIHSLVQSFKLLSDLRTQNTVDKINSIYRNKEMNAWAKGIAYLLQIIKSQHMQLIELWTKVNSSKQDIASDFYVEQIQHQLNQIISEKGILYKSNQHFKELIDNYLQIDSQQQQQQMKQLRKFSNNINLDTQFNELPDKYKNKIEILLKNYEVQDKNIKRQEPPPIFHSATVPISNLIQSRKYNQNPFNDISSLDNASEHQLDDSNPIQQIEQQQQKNEKQQQYSENDSLLQGGKLKFKEDEFLSQNRQKMIKQLQNNNQQRQ